MPITLGDLQLQLLQALPAPSFMVTLPWLWIESAQAAGFHNSSNRQLHGGASQCHLLRVSDREYTTAGSLNQLFQLAIDLCFAPQ
jgi:hypothetical protein